MEHEKIAVNQFMILVLLYTLGSAIIFIPHIVIKHAQQDAWIASFLSLFIGLLPLVIYLKMAKVFPGKTFVEMLTATFGQMGGKIVGLFILVGFHLNLTVMTLRDFGDFLVVHLLPETPLYVVVLLLLIVVAYAVKKGIEVIARAGQILAPVAIFFFLLSAILLLQKSEPSNLLPIMEKGWKPIVRASIPNIGFPFLETLPLLVLFPFVQSKGKLGKSLVLGVFLGGMMIGIAVIYSLLVFGVEYSSTKMYVPYLLGAEINIADVIQRVEVIIASIWIISIYIKICIQLLTTTIFLQNLCGSTDYRFYVLPISLLCLPLSILMMPNMSYWGVIENVWPFYAFVFSIIIPSAMLFIHTVKGK